MKPILQIRRRPKLSIQRYFTYASKTLLTRTVYNPQTFLARPKSYDFGYGNDRCPVERFTIFFWCNLISFCLRFCSVANLECEDVGDGWVDISRKAEAMVCGKENGALCYDGNFQQLVGIRSLHAAVRFGNDHEMWSLDLNGWMDGWIFH